MLPHTPATTRTSHKQWRARAAAALAQSQPGMIFVARVWPDTLDQARPRYAPHRITRVRRIRQSLSRYSNLESLDNRSSTHQTNLVSRKPSFLHRYLESIYSHLYGPSGLHPPLRCILALYHPHAPRLATRDVVVEPQSPAGTALMASCSPPTCTLNLEVDFRYSILHVIQGPSL